MGGAWLWARRDLVRSWRSLVGLALIAGLAGGAVLAATAGARRADSAIDRSLDRGTFWEVSAFATEPIPEVMAWLATEPRVADVAELRVLLATPVGQMPGVDGAMMVPTNQSTFDRIWVVEGRAPVRATEVVVTEATARRRSLRVGDRVPFHYGTFAEQEDCVTEPLECDAPTRIGDLTVSGIFRSPAELVPGHAEDVYAAAPELLASLGPVEEVTSARWVHVGLHERDDAASFAAELSLRMPEGDAVNEAAVLDPARRAAGVFGTGIRTAALVAGLAALVAISQAVMRHFATFRVETTTLAALGMAQGERAAGAALPAMGAAALAAATAVVVAVALSPMFPVGLARRADPDPGVHADWWVLAPGALAVALLAAVIFGLAAWRSARLGRARRRTTPRPSLVARTTERLGLSPAPATGARFALELGRDDARARTGHVVVTVGLVVAVAAGALVVRDNLAAVLDRPERYGVMWDLAIDLPDREPATMSVVEELTADPRVEGASLVSSGELTLRTGSVESQVTAIGTAPLSGRIPPAVLEGRSAEGPDEILVGPATMDDLDLEVGDEVLLEGGAGPAGDAPQRASRVVGTGMLPLSAITEIDDGLLLPLQTFDELGADQLVADIDAHSALLLEVPAAADAAAIEAELDAAYGDIVWRPSRPADVSVLDELTSVPPLLAVFAGLLGILVVLQSLVAGLRRRRGELAVLRALGFRSSQVGSVVLWQAGVLAVVAAAIGIPLGLVAGRSVWRAIAEGADVVPVVDLPVGGLALLGAAVGVVALGAAVFPAHRAARMRPVDALRTE